MHDDLDEEIKPKKKKKNPIVRFFKFLKIFIVLTLLTVIGFFIYLCVNIVSNENFSGNDNVQNIAKENKNLSEVSNYIITDSLTSLQNSDSNSLDISLSETNMNYVLHAVSKNIDLDPLKVKNIYTTYNSDSNYSLYIPVEFLFFKSCLYGSMDLKYDSNSDNLVIKIEKLNLGKISTNNFLIKNIILKAIKAETINNIFTSKGLESKTDISGSTITISIKSSSIGIALTKSLDNTDIAIIDVLYNILDNSDNLSYIFTKEEIGIRANLSNVITTTNSSIENDKFEDVKDKMIKLIKRDSANNNNASTILTYLINGYDMISEEKRNVINNADLSPINLSTLDDKESYKGIIDRSSDKVALEISLLDSLLALKNKQFSLTVNEDLINKEIKKNEIIGLSKAYISRDGNSFSYIVIENIYINIFENKMNLNLVLNINSKEVVFTICLGKVSGNGNLVTKIDNIKVGNLDVNNSYYKDVLEFLSENISLDYLDFDTINEHIVLDFKQRESDILSSLIKEGAFSPEYNLKEHKFELVYLTLDDSKANEFIDIINNSRK